MSKTLLGTEKVTGNYQRGWKDEKDLEHDRREDSDISYADVTKEFERNTMREDKWQ